MTIIPFIISPLIFIVSLFNLHYFFLLLPFSFTLIMLSSYQLIYDLELIFRRIFSPFVGLSSSIFIELSTLIYRLALTKVVLQLFRTVIHFWQISADLAFNSNSLPGKEINKIRVSLEIMFYIVGKSKAPFGLLSVFYSFMYDRIRHFRNTLISILLDSLWS